MGTILWRVLIPDGEFALALPLRAIMAAPHLHQES